MTEVAAQASPAAYVLGLADDAMVYAQRLAEWMSNAPQIEEDMALGNIALDLLGQARALYPHVGTLDGTGRSEDDFAMVRDERDWRNVHLVEQERGDFGQEMARLLWFATYQRELYAALLASSDPVLAGVAGKALKEVRYHLDHAALWVVRLGDGTEESHTRMQAALDSVLPYLPELFFDDEASVAAAESGIGVLPSSLHEAVTTHVAAVCQEATLDLHAPTWRARGGRAGIHSKPMGYLLAEMQHIARSHPGATW
ncbi:phenylacetate-CoA oxygenase subunit PaaC [Intrasporangium calvum]|uniref:Phenylacetate-CoA oxygenase subunit PaaC n=1 Tax=Intrasporangium calvum TaxID=53358 RepID=A0ABT5GD79_9MICO|nr:1,2-phenylacetyl-CoA epoxidase subunit PaaC [Intrasporangium calvum]MDC5695816.1 phenylacetate-CoA oxygenase subunit PaaC [Intrasporangium calvum]